MDYVYFIGIDVGKESFDVAGHAAPRQKTQRFSNDATGITAFQEAFADFLPHAFVVLEATGGYEASLLGHLVAAGVAVHRATPLQAMHFLRSLRLHGKTDHLDAVGLARYGAERHAELPRYRLPDAGQARLLGCQARRSDLVAMRVAEQNRLVHPRYAGFTKEIEAMCALLNEQIRSLELEIAALIEQSEELSSRLRILTTVKGVGVQTAYTLLAAMPELGTLTRRQAASLAGLAPHPRDSGSLHGYRATRGGRASVKRAIFMAAMAARRFHPKLKEFYERLVKNGKRKMVALVAVMRKLVVILNALLRDAAAQLPPAHA